MQRQTDFPTLLGLAQEYISAHYSAALTDPDKKERLRAYAEQFIRDGEWTVPGMSSETAADMLFREMAEYSILTPYLGSPGLEEINVNGWDDIALTYAGGRVEKLREHFYSPRHALDVIKRLLHHSGMIIDNATPAAQGHLPGNSRITALKDPVIDAERGVCVSIRLLRPSGVSADEIADSGFATREIADFLCACVRYGVPFVIAGATSSGKTTLLGAILSAVPDSKRIFTIESGSRELDLIRRDAGGRVLNNVVHTLSRPSDNPAYDITQEDLVVASLRFNPDVVCVGEMRDVECYSAVEASLTGHTVVSTVHAGPAESAHMRIALLCQKRFPIDFSTSMIQAAQAFPVVVYTHKLENSERKIMDVSECVIDLSGGRRYRRLYGYDIDSNAVEEGKTVIRGRFTKPDIMSESLYSRFMRYGAPRELLERFAPGGGAA